MQQAEGASLLKKARLMYMDSYSKTPTLVMGNVYGHYPLEQNPCQLTCITQNTLQPNMERKITLQRSIFHVAHWIPHVPFRQDHTGKSC